MTQPTPGGPQNAASPPAETGPAGRVAMAAAARDAAARQWADADDQFRTAIRAALAEGVDPAAVARCAGIGLSRVYQIRDGRTGHERKPTSEDTP